MEYNKRALKNAMLMKKYSYHLVFDPLQRFGTLSSYPLCFESFDFLKVSFLFVPLTRRLRVLPSKTVRVSYST